MSSVVRFPTRRCSAVFVCPEPLGGYYVVIGSHGWLFGSLTAARAEAQAIAGHLGLTIRETSPSAEYRA
jgi:hypothetical protein